MSDDELEQAYYEARMEDRIREQQDQIQHSIDLLRTKQDMLDEEL